MLSNRTARWRGPRFALGMMIVVLGLVGAGAWLSAREQGTSAKSTLAAPKPVTLPPTTQTRVLGAQKTVWKQRANPVRITIPAIGVNASVVPLGLNPDQTMEVMKSFTATGWFQPGPEPGEQGAAVIVGHVSSRSGPAVFSRLPQLKVGQLITIRLQDGSSVRYAAKSMIKVSKNHFPTNRVYAKTKQPTLRLVTCAGKVDSTGYHPDNYIVFASIVQ
jgi:LPXTG-site transpeptidase (sortase) family protein